MIGKTALGLAILVASIAISPAATAETADILDGYLWKKRLFFVFGDQTSRFELNEQLARLARDPAGLKERDLEVFVGEARKRLEILGTRLSPRTLRNHLGLPATGFAAALVGKDGGVKMRSTTPVPLQTDLYTLIDAMPMRQQEMRRQTGGSEMGGSNTGMN